MKQIWLSYSLNKILNAFPLPLGRSPNSLAQHACSVGSGLHTKPQYLLRSFCIIYSNRHYKLPWMYSPQTLTCSVCAILLDNSYSSFRTQLQGHLLQETFPAGEYNGCDGMLWILLPPQNWNTHSFHNCWAYDRPQLNFIFRDCPSLKKATCLRSCLPA